MAAALAGVTGWSSGSASEARSADSCLALSRTGAELFDRSVPAVVVDRAAAERVHPMAVGPRAWNASRSKVYWWSLTPAGRFGGLYESRPDGSRRRFVSDLDAEGLNPGGLLELAPNGASVAFLANRAGGPYGLYVAAVDGGAITEIAAGDIAVTNVTWSPDSKQLAWVQVPAPSNSPNFDDTNVMLGAANGAGTPIVLIDSAITFPGFFPPLNPPASINGLKWSPDGTRLAFTGYDGAGINVLAADLWIFTIGDDLPVQVANNAANQISHRGLVWSPSGDTLYSGYAGSADLNTPLGGVIAVDVSGPSVRTLTDDVFHFATTAISPDGTTVAFVAFPLGDDATNSAFYTVPTAGGAVARLGAVPADTSGSGVLVFTPCTALPPKCGGRFPTVVGSPFDDARVSGTEGKDVILAQGGNDTVAAGGGNDLVCGGAGKDVIAGGAGKDRLYGEAGKDSLAGEAGNDRLDGGAARDRCDGGPGRDRGTKCERDTSIP